MRDVRERVRPRGCLLALAILAIVVSLIRLFIWYELRAIYSNEVLVVLPSPTGAWTARVVEYTVEGQLVTDIVAEVELISHKHPNVVTSLLGVDTSGHQSERPHIAWSAPNVLRVTVPDISYMKIGTLDADGVQVDLRYDPDDPAAHAAWRKRMESRPER